MRKLGRYALLHRFATGDHGDVYLARLSDRLPRGELGVGELCAVKVVRGDVATDIEHSRLLLAEGATAVRFRHPAAVRVYEVEREGAEPYTAMDYCSGQTVGAILQREASQGTSLPVHLVAWIGAEVAAVLEAGSQRAWSPAGTGPMVHGGVSPRSVLVDYSGEIRVLGMGGGRARMYLPVPKSRLAYAAPEVITERPPDRRTDLFSLGVLLHDLLTGTRLFRRATDAETRDAILEGRASDAAPALATFDRELSRLVLAMLERASDRRPRDAESVESVLRGFAGDPGAARAELTERLDRAFREERDAQRRVIDAAVRRAGSMPGARPPPTHVVEARGGSSAGRAVVERGSSALSRGGSGVERATRGESSVDRGPGEQRGGSAAGHARSGLTADRSGSERAPLPDVGSAADRIVTTPDRPSGDLANDRALPRARSRDPMSTQRDVPQMMRAVSGADRERERERERGPRAPSTRADVMAAAELSAHVGSRTAPDDILDDLEPITISGMPRVHAGDGEARAAPVHLIPVEIPTPGAFDELLPELFSGSVPLLSEREEPETLDIGDRPDVAIEVTSGTPIPLTRRSSKPDRRELLTEATWEGEIGELPAWGTNLDLAPTFALALGPVDESRAVPVADAEGSLSDLLDAGADTVDPLLSDPGGPSVLRYRRARQLGVSEVATVFEAQDAVLGRAVALKVSELGEEEGARLDRDTRIRVLRREGRLAAELFHPRLPTLLDAGRDGDVYFLAYQLVDGEDLDRQVAQRGPVSAARARVILRDLAEALVFLHQRRLSHGDLSAANVLIEPDGHARLLDFSMAVAEGTEHPLELTYDPTADVRALGALGVWMIAGGPRISDVSKLDPELAQLLSRLEGAQSPAELIGVLAILEGAPRKSPSSPVRPPNVSSSPGSRIPRAASSPGAPSPLDALERPAAPLGIGFEAIAQALEVHLRRGTAYDPPDRDAYGPLARAVARRLTLGPESEAVSALLLAARALTLRFGMKPRQAVAEGLLAPVIGARLLELDERLLGGRDADPVPTALEVATVVEAYAMATQVGDDGRRVSPRRAVLALRERADEGRFDGRVVEALIDHLRTTISALEVPPRERIMVVGLSADDPVASYLSARGFPLELHAEVEPALLRGFADRPPWGIVTERSAARRLTERLRADGRAGDVPLVIMGGGADDTLDESAPISLVGRVEVLPRSAPPERVMAALAERARPR